MGLGELVGETLNGFGEKLVKGFTETFQPKAVKGFKDDVSLNSIDVDLFQTVELKDYISNLKKSWEHSPENPSDIARDLINIVSGKASAVQLEHIMGEKFGENTPISDRIFDQIAIITDVTLLSNIMSIIGSFFPFLNLHIIGEEIRSYLDYSGLSQVTGYGYGMLISSVLTPMITKEINSKMQKELPSISEAVSMNHRGKLDDAGFDDLLMKYGLNQTYRDGFNEIKYFYPSPQDFITFLVRDTFNPEIVEKYGYMTDFPEAILEHTEKGGLKEEWVRHYWAAHWNLPSVTAAYEMMHRQEIGHEELDTLLKIADYPDYWREKLINISYSPFTRVDVRRMRKLNVITVAESITAYKDIGYNQEKAEMLSLFTEKYNQSGERDLSKTEIMKLYEQGAFLSPECEEMLKDLGYDEIEAGYIISLSDYKIIEKELKETIKTLTTSFIESTLTEAQFTAKLDLLNLPESRRSKIIVDAINKKQGKIRMPSKEDAVKWYSQGLLTPQELRDLLSEIHIPEKYHSYYMGQKS
tara:strand:+ start:1431 stop:3011 length:1581 start_codon:yes stop_codon:yes gene_type:complete